MYKKQTLERLMVDEETKTAPPLPSSEEVAETPVSASVEAEAAADDTLDPMAQLPEIEEWAAPPPPEADTPDELDAPDGLDELWTLAGSGEEDAGILEPEETPHSSMEDTADSQSAEEALAALRAIADGVSREDSPKTSRTETTDEHPTLLDESGIPDDVAPLPDLESEDPLEALRRSWASDEVAEEEEPSSEAPEDLLEADDEDDPGVGVPSILERLMEEPRRADEDSADDPAEIAAEADAAEEDAPFDDLFDLMDDVVAPLDDELTLTSDDAESTADAKADANAEPEGEVLETASAEKPAETPIAEGSEKAPAETAAAKVVPFPVQQQDAPPPEPETSAPEQQPPPAQEQPATVAAEAAASTETGTIPKPAASRKRKKLPLRAAMVMASIEVQPRGLDSVAGDDWRQAALRAAWGKDSAPAPLRNGAASALPVRPQLDVDRVPCRLDGALQARFLAEAVAAKPAEITAESTLDTVPEPPRELLDLAWTVEWPKSWSEPPAADRELLRLSAVEDVVGIEPTSGPVSGAPGEGLPEALGGLAQVCTPTALFYAAPSTEQEESGSDDSEGLGADWDVAVEENFGGFDLDKDD